MRSQQLSDVMGMLDEELLAPALEAQARRQPERHVGVARWRRWVPRAACACLALALVGGLSWGALNHQGTITPPGAGTTPGSGEGVNPEDTVNQVPALVIPALDSAYAEPGESVGPYPRHFIYNGETYTRKECLGVVSAALVGDYLGTVRNELTVEEGTGEETTLGDVYALKGYDSSFMVYLAAPGTSGERYVYLRDNNLTLGAGAELLEDRLHLSTTYGEARGVTHESWGSGLADDGFTLSATEENVRTLINVLDERPFISLERANERCPWGSVYDAPSKLHLRLCLSTGLTVTLNLYGSTGEKWGIWYASLESLPGAWLSFSTADAPEVIDALGALSPTTRQVQAAYQEFLADKTGYYRILQLKGMSTPVLLVSKKRDKLTYGAYGCTVYEYANGAVRKVGSVRCSSTAYNLCTYQGCLVYAGNHDASFVTVEHGVLEGERYSRVWDGDGNATYYRSPLKDGEAGSRTEVSAEEGAQRMGVDEAVGVQILEFTKIAASK